MEGYTRFVRGVQTVTALVAAAFAVMLFVNEPAKPPPIPKAAEANTGQVIYANRCAGCHGVDGGGSFGPALGNGVVVGSFPNPADQVAVVSNGRGSMPSFSDSLNDDQLQAVVEYTRTELGK